MDFAITSNFSLNFKNIFFYLYLFIKEDDKFMVICDYYQGLMVKNISSILEQNNLKI